MSHSDSGFFNLIQAAQDDYAANKHKNYEKRITKKLMEAMGYTSQDIRIKEKGLDEEFDLVWFNETHPSVTFNFGVAKVDRDFNIAFLFDSKSVTKQVWWSAYQEMKDNYPDSPIALVFDKHGDGIPDIVLHEFTSYAENNNHICFTQGKTTYYIQSFKSFLGEFSKRERI